MSRPKTKFVQAKRKFNSVYYFPFGNEPGDPYVLTSDPWSYLKAFIKNEHDRIKNKTIKNGPVKDRLKKALYFVSLAESFLKSAENIELPTKGTLTYYSILNLTKAFLLVRGYDLESNTEYHGLSLNSAYTDQLTISKNAKDGGINIFHSFAKELGYTVTPNDKISLREMISNLPEIHEMTFNLGLLNKTKRKFLPIKIEFISNDKKWSKLSYRICFEKKHKNNYRVDKFGSGILNTKLSKSEDINEQETYISKQIRNLTHESDTSWCNNYELLSNEIKAINVRTMLTRMGFKYYLDLQPDKFDSAIYSYALIFYIGSVARYRPTLNEEILEGDYKAVISETMNSTPKQFLYLMTGLITKKVCAVPMASLE